MKAISSYYFIASLWKRLFFLLGVLSFLGWTGCGAAGGFSIDAPVADIEGGTLRAAVFCDTIQGAPEGSTVRITNQDDSNIEPVESPLAADGSFSLKACVLVGQSVDIQVFDADGNAISPVATVKRATDDRTNVCPDQTNPDPVCPPLM